MQRGASALHAQPGRGTQATPPEVPLMAEQKAPAAQPPIAELRHVSKTYGAEGGGEHTVLGDVSLAIAPGEVVAIVGPSGCGKSTLLRLLAGLVPPSSGEVLCKGKPLRGLHSGAAIVFQAFGLFPWLTVKQNVRVGLERSRQASRSREEDVRRAVALVGLAGFEEAFPRELSGGMKQRVGFARAMVSQPELLCLDEPFASLDVFTAEALRGEVTRLWLRPDTGLRSILLITHSIEEAISLGDRVVVMAARPGRIHRIIQNELPRPREERSPGFLAKVAEVRETIRRLQLPDEAEPGVLTGHSPAAAAPLTPEPLPGVPMGQVTGLLEVLADHGGEMEVGAIDFLTGFDFDHTIAVVKAGEILGLLETPGSRVVLTAAGRAYLGGDVQARKRQLRAAMSRLPTFQFLLELLSRAPGRRLPARVARAALAARLPPHERIDRIFQTVLTWSRDAGLFGYAAGRREVSLLDDDTPGPGRPTDSAANAP